MFKTLDSDRYMIERKYHNPDKEFDSFNRMAYHGYDYDESTGLDDNRIDKGLYTLAEKLNGLPHPIYKAHMFEYILNNTRIDVNESDYFVGIYSWNRLASKYTVHKWSSEVYKSFPDESRTMLEYDESGACFGWLDYDHTVPDWDNIMEFGFAGLLDHIEKCYAKISNPTEKQTAFYKGLKIEYTAVINLIGRLHKYSLTKTHKKASAVSECLEHLLKGAPTDTYEALQLIYIYFMLSESVEHYQVRSLGHGLDSTLYPFYKKDIESGRYTKEEIAEFIGYFLMQWSAIGNYWGQPFYLGGINTDGSTKVNELSYLILDVYDKSGLYNPKIQIKINNSTPKDFVIKALDMIRHGINSIVFCNDDIITKCLMARNATYEEAVNSVISGCYEYKLKAKDIGISVSYFNLLKPVSLVFDNGYDTVSGRQIGTKTGEIDSLTTFDKFYKAYLKQLEHIVTEYLGAITTLETKVADINPSLLFSGTINACVENMTDAIDEGIENTTDILISGIGSATDALMAVYELVYRTKTVTLSELKHALDSDWNGYEELRAKALLINRKYGNGDEMSDNYAAAIVRFVHNLLAGKKNSHGGKFNLELHSARAFILHGEKTKATPDGRKAGEETSKNASPTQGSDRNGITALINSATTIDTTLADSGFCLDVMLHPSTVQGEKGLQALYSVLSTYMQKGGASVHFNIFNVEMLKDAQKNPQQYKNLQVRICGWNALWNNLSTSEQNAYILRAEHISE